MKILSYRNDYPTSANDVWCAIDEDTYDGAPDGGNQIGYGRTEARAIADLMCIIETGDGLAYGGFDE